MDADWEVEIGGGAPVIEALWPGFVDLRRTPERLGEIVEAANFPALADLLRALNATGSPLWTAKCDLWETEPGELATTESACDAEAAVAGEQSFALACYVDLLPVEGQVFAQWTGAESFCRRWVDRLGALPLADCRVDLVVRQAIAGAVEGFGITAYVGGTGRGRSAAAEALSAAMVAFANAIPAWTGSATAAAKLQWKNTGE
jgi:hypothetical protein